MAASACDVLFRNARILTCRDGEALIKRGAVAAADGRIVFVGPERDVPPVLSAAETVDLGGRLVTPGLIDCHTHLVFAGDRSGEWRMRLEGESYEAIARAGGGIVSSVRATRAASEDDLVTASLPRLDTLMAEGVTTVEIKSGYGLDTVTEAKMLRAATALGALRDVMVVRTFLGAHALPPEMNGDRDRYITQVCDEQLPAIAADGLADAVDAFCEGIAFSPAQVERVFAAAKRHGLPVKLHAEQLSDLGGAVLAARHGALSADHLEHLGADGIAAMAEAGTVAVLLPGAYYVLRETKKPPVAALRDAGVPMAVATDSNPGTSPLTSPLLAMHMAVTLFGLTIDEAILGMTRNAARALGLSAEIGTLEVAKWCDLAVWDADSPAGLLYRIGFNPLVRRVRRGR